MKSMVSSGPIDGRCIKPVAICVTVWHNSETISREPIQSLTRGRFTWAVA